MSEKEFRGISLRAELVNEIEEYIKGGTSRYRSIADFIADAVRRRFEELGVKAKEAS